MPKPLALNLLTIYADLAQSLPDLDAASISRRKINGGAHLYAVHPGGRQEYLGAAGNAEAEARAASYRAASARARARRKAITALKAAGIPAPDPQTGRLITALARSGLFERGAVLVGTAAFQLYPLPVAAALTSSALLTRDADVAIARLAVKQMDGAPPLESILKSADPTFAPRFHRDQREPCTWISASGFIVDVLTTAGRSREPLHIGGLDCAALPLPYLDYLIEEPILVVALVGSGVRVAVPQPVRFALHKLIVAQRRPAGEQAKAAKDIVQARELLDVLSAHDADSVTDAIDDMKQRGPTWRKALAAGLAKINWGA